MNGEPLDDDGRDAVRWLATAIVTAVMALGSLAGAVIRHIQDLLVPAALFAFAAGIFGGLAIVAYRRVTARR